MAGLGRDGVAALLKQHRLPPVPKVSAGTFEAACGPRAGLTYCIIAALVPDVAAEQLRFMRAFAVSRRWPEACLALCAMATNEALRPLTFGAWSSPNGQK